MRRLLLGLLFSVAALNGFAQGSGGMVRGVLFDSVGKYPLTEATVSVVAQKDSALVSFTLTSKAGSFEIKNIPWGSYQVISSSVGLQTKSDSFSVSPDKAIVDLGSVYLSPLYKTMDEVVVRDNAPVRIKGDTLAFNASAFKTKPNAVVEDLLKKLPGVQVDRNGTVVAQGEEVQKVYVDGKEFFGNDPKMATKNLTADMIDQVEIYNDMSEGSKFNKIDDGSRSKAINLKLKKDKKKGVFGKLYGGYGTDERYDAGMNAYFFNGARQAAVIAKTNNINSPAFTSRDLLGSNGGNFGGGPGNRGGGASMARSSGGTAGNLNPANTGITSSSQAGGNFKDLWGANVEVTGSYLFGRLQTINAEHIFRQTFGKNAITFTAQDRASQNGTNNHTANLNLTWFVDSFNSVTYASTFSYQSINNFSNDTTAIYAIDSAGQRQDINQSRQRAEGLGQGLTWNNNLIWRKRFRRPGRTLSVSFNNTLNDTEREAYNLFSARINPRNTYINHSGNTHNYSTGFSYTEPLSRNKMVEVNYNYANNNNESDRRANLFNSSTGKYDIVDQRQTNSFANTNKLHRFGANYRFFERTYSYQLGFSLQQAVIESNNLTKAARLKQTFTNLFPVALFNYQFRRNKSLRFAYRGNTRQPSITQLQEVLDETAAPYFYRGNAGLKQEFSNDLRLTYNSFDMARFRNFFAVLSFSNTYNQIGNSIKDTVGGQITAPVNLSGYYAVAGNFNLGFPIKKLNGGNFNASTRLFLNRQPAVFNGEKIFTRNFNMGEDLRLNYNHNEKLDVGITASVNYNSVTYTTKIKTAQDESYFTHTYSADISYSLPKNFLVTTDLDYTVNAGRTAGYNQNFILWNASLAKQFLRNNRGEMKVSVFDLLNQNTSVGRNVGPSYLEDIRSLTLQRYFLLTFTYNINRMGGKSIPATKRIG